jgi:predicted phosphodiesterase
MAMQAFAECGVDVLLAGHLHTSHASNSAQRYKISGYAALVVQAGTATSTRGRGESNSFNVLRVAPDDVQVVRYSWIEGTASFEPVHTECFRRSGDVWSLAGEA